jgi:peptidoglycan-associated lipoprotein
VIGMRAWVTLFLAAALAAGCSKQVLPMPSSALRSPSAGVAGGSASPVPASPRAVDSSMADAVRSSAATTTPPGAATWTPVDGRSDPTEFKPVADLTDIHFDFDQYAVRPDDQRVLDAHASWLRARPRALLVIEGHCDERGTSEYNIALGERRAKAAMNHLVSRGIDARRMTVISYGAHRPACVDPGESCWARNRRAHFRVKLG